jgi:PAS domain S-box-containing protein
MKSFFTSLSFSKKYIFALSLIATFSILAYINLSTLINSQSDDGKIINISGRQRMLSQKIALFSINYKTKNLQKSVALMEESHNTLVSLEMSDELRKIYFEQPILLDEKVKKYIQSAKSFLEKRDGHSLTYILKNSQDLLKRLDIAVSAYQHETELKIKKLQTNELFILVLTLTTLLLEALFIFRPVDKSVKKKTQELKSEKNFADMITQINTNAIIAVDEEFKIHTFNKSAEKMFGYSADEMLHTKLVDDRLIPTKYLQQHNNGLMMFMENGKLKKPNEVHELEGHHKDKTTFPIRISFGAKVEENKKIIVANIQNITAEKEKDDLILQQSRYAAMGQMIGNIEHQLRHPLSSISAISSGAKLRYKNNLISDEELMETFDKIKEHTQHLSKTIDDFKDFFRENESTDSFEIGEVLNKSIVLTEASYKSNHIEMVVENMETKVTINGSGSKLSQVILNILNNAKDILLEKNVSNKMVLVKTMLEDGYVVIKIYDNAGGIDKSIKSKIFDPYFTTKHKSQGTGVGLFMSKKIIAQHFKGDIEAKNKAFVVDGKKYFGALFIIKIEHA